MMKNKKNNFSFHGIRQRNMVFIAGFEPVFIDHYKNSSEFDLDKLRKEIKNLKNILVLYITYYNVNSSQ